MKNIKILYLLLVLSFAVLAGCQQTKEMKESAAAASKASDSLLKKFKEVDQELQSAKVKFDSAGHNLKDSFKTPQ